VLAVIRHGDRTPKQKIKVNVTHPLLLDVLMRHGPHQPGKLKQAKLKSPNQLQELLDAVRQILRQAEPLEEPSPDDGHLNKLRQVKDVLEQGGQFSGINRKAQLKPLRWESVDLATATSERAARSDSGGLARTMSEPLSEPSDGEERPQSMSTGASPLAKARRRSDVVSDGDGGVRP